jgi:hypothetical protein
MSTVDKRLSNFASKVGSLTTSLEVPELKQKKLDRDADLKAKAEATAAESVKARKRLSKHGSNSLLSSRFKLSSTKKFMSEPKSTKKSMLRFVVNLNPSHIMFLCRSLKLRLITAEKLKQIIKYLSLLRKKLYLLCESAA